MSESKPIQSALRREGITIAIALGVALLAGSVLTLLVGESPLEVFALLLEQTWGKGYGFGQVIFKSTPLILTGLSVAIAFRVGLFNIGAEGQMFMGSFATALCGAYLPAATPGVIAIPLCVLVGALAGGLWGAIPGVLRAYYDAHEVINTIMLNFIAAALILWLGNEVFFATETTRTQEIIASAQLSKLDQYSGWFNDLFDVKLFRGSNANTSIVLAVVLAVVVHLFLTRTRRGYEWGAVGLNKRAAENGGIDVRVTIIAAMTLSGALAGAVGANFVLGYKYFFENGMGAGVGFMGIAVALLGRNHPIGIIAAALLFGTLSHGGLEVNRLVPKEIVSVLQAIIILAVAATAAVMYARQKKRKAGTKSPGAGGGGRVRIAPPGSEAGGGGETHG